MLYYILYIYYTIYYIYTYILYIKLLVCTYIYIYIYIYAKVPLQDRPAKTLEFCQCKCSFCIGNSNYFYLLLTMVSYLRHTKIFLSKLNCEV